MLIQILNLQLKFNFLFCLEQLCATPDQRQGQCVDLRRCASLLKLIKNPNLSIADRNFLRNSQCAYNGYPWVKTSNEITIMKTGK